MAKELPYFKFEPNAWDNGNIQILSREEKGLFIDLCSMYWSRLGDVPYKLALQKLCAGNANALQTLCDENIIEVINEVICIDFLNEQLGEFENKSKTNSRIAKEGWKKRHKQREESERNANASKTQSESDAIREEKRREEERREDEKPKPKIQKEFSEAVRVCFLNCLDFFPEHYRPQSQKLTNQWMDTIHKLNTIEKIPFESIEAITKWAREGWWAKNFQSLLKLRKKNSDGIMYLSIFNDGMSAKPVFNANSTAETRQEINRELFNEAIKN